MTKRKVQVDADEIRRLRNQKGLSVPAFCKLTPGLGVRTMREIEATGLATEERLQCVAKVLKTPHGTADLKPLLVAGRKVIECREKKAWSTRHLANEIDRLRTSLGESHAPDDARLADIQTGLTLIMHAEWRLLAAALECTPQSLLVNLARSSLSSDPSIADEHVDNLTDAIIRLAMARQDAATGAFNKQAWVTAQMLFGLLHLKHEVTTYRDELCAALDYLFTCRTPHASPTR
ncbi:MAG: hypothetical protein WD875_04560 [Pirellulales bacterium]